MGRRIYYGDKPRASLTDSAVDEAANKINTAGQKAVRVLTEYTPSREKTIEMLFEPSVIHRATQARGIVYPANEIVAYDLAPDDTTAPTLYINYHEARCLPINKDQMKLQLHLCEPLMAFVAQVKAIHDQYEEVKGVLRWFNRNATISAVRYYWPTALQLCPGQMREYHDMPSRHNSPPGISDMLQAIRDSAATWASSQMLPVDAEKRPRKLMWLTFGHHIVHCGAQSYRTGQITYNF